MQSAWIVGIRCFHTHWHDGPVIIFGAAFDEPVFVKVENNDSAGFESAMSWLHQVLACSKRLSIECPSPFVEKSCRHVVDKHPLELGFEVGDCSVPFAVMQPDELAPLPRQPPGRIDIQAILGEKVSKRNRIRLLELVKPSGGDIGNVHKI
ncbi:hypothetical protein N234_37555 [Ralstonia pickettii DTP0602]|nr:hypothetical protein N234_37555 [Ralstonia pickettii DTP0602]